MYTSTSSTRAPRGRTTGPVHAYIVNVTKFQVLKDNLKLQPILQTKLTHVKCCTLAEGGPHRKFESRLTLNTIRHLWIPFDNTLFKFTYLETNLEQQGLCPWVPQWTEVWPLALSCFHYDCNTWLPADAKLLVLSGVVWLAMLLVHVEQILAPYLQCYAPPNESVPWYLVTIDTS